MLWSLFWFISVPVKVPAGLANFPHELVFVPEALTSRKYPQLVQYSNMERGGHFAAFEEPQLLAQDIISFVKKVEDMKRNKK